MKQQDIQILSGLLSGELQPGDEIVRAWVQEDPAREALLQEPDRLRQLLEERQLQQSFSSGKMWDNFLANEAMKQQKGVAIPLRKRYWYAAAAVILLLGAGYLGWQMNARKPAASQVAAASTMLPLGSKAVLQAGTQQVTLAGSDSSFGLAGNQVQLKNGQLKINGQQPVQYTLSTPRGSTYSIQLPDGTMVWLNAASRISYPSVFKEDTRSVEVEGEAFFSVAANEMHPFVVHSGGQQVLVLGTTFNIRAYPGEPQLLTTLVSGKVQVRTPAGSSTLTPGWQTTCTPGSWQLQQAAVDTTEIISWKNGWIRFRDKPLGEVLAAVSKWYDVDVRLQDESLSQQHFTCYIDKEQTLGQIIELLNRSTNQLKITLEPGIITVSKK